jgi:uncharacterized surface protein with fasciclin (FAS1) repeats
MKPWITTNCVQMTALALLLVLFSSLTTVSQAGDLFDEISSNPELKEFYNLCKNTPLASTNWRTSAMTAFAFSNAALNRYAGKLSTDLCSYHMTPLYAPVAQFPASLPSFLVSSSPLWATKVLTPGTQGKVEFYVNNALVIQQDRRSQTSTGMDQILHIIDEVLEPLAVFSQDINAVNPSAYKVMAEPQKYGIASSLRNFKTRVDLMNRDVIFSGGDGSTFFIVHDGNVKQDIWNHLDARVIDAHVIKEGVMFTRPFPDQPQDTLAFADNFKVTISLKNESVNSGKQFQLYAHSNNPFHSPTYPSGVVVSRIIYPNIPVKNGVVHIIEGPLVLITKNLLEFIQDMPSLSEFYDLIRNHGPEMLTLLSDGGDKTLFAPTNDAVRSIDPARLGLIQDKPQEWRDLLLLHLVQQRVTAQFGSQPGLSFPSSDGRRKLILESSPRGVTVIGGGANATIINADVAAINGILHIIDNVLGIPYMAIYNVLQTNPQFSTTFDLGFQNGFNTQLSLSSKKFTYFVPTNYAWEKVQHNYRNEFSRMQSKSDTYNTVKILERHLVVNQGYRLSDLIALRSIRTVNSVIEVTTDTNGRVVLQWNGVSALIEVSDIEATNGYVHSIGTVLMKKDDLTSGSPMPFTSLSFLTLILLPILIVKLLA